MGRWYAKIGLFVCCLSGLSLRKAFQVHLNILALGTFWPKNCTILRWTPKSKNGVSTFEGCGCRLTSGVWSASCVCFVCCVICVNCVHCVYVKCHPGVVIWSNYCILCCGLRENFKKLPAGSRLYNKSLTIKANKEESFWWLWFLLDADCELVLARH